MRLSLRSMSKGKLAALLLGLGPLGLSLSTTGCGDEATTVSFHAPTEVLPDVTAADGKTFTSSVRATAGSSKAGPILVADPMAGKVLALEDCSAGCKSAELSSGLLMPVRARMADLDGEGRSSFLIADIGEYEASDAPKGRIMAIDDDGKPARTLVSGLARVVCAEPADLDKDGDTDLVACVFGSTQGELMWAEKTADGSYVRHTIDPLAGTADAFPFDADGDGDLDIAAEISQDNEEVNLYRNDGHGSFTKESLIKSHNACYGMSSLHLADLDQDGDTDILVTNGDDMDTECHGAAYQGQHGLAWLENDGRGHFTYHDLLRIYGSYVVRTADLDGDGDLDIVLANDNWDEGYVPPGDWAALLWLENDGKQGFQRHDIAGAPPAMLAMDVVDFDGDGTMDIVAGSFNGEGPMPGSRRLLAWKGERVRK